MELNVENLVKAMNLEVVAGAHHLNKRVKGGYCGDLLSDVMANSKEGDVWITVQTHQNIVAVAVLKEHAAIIIAGNREADPESIEKAEKEGIPLLRSPLNGFLVSGMLYKLFEQGENA
ncbi:MAG: DRTGG domain-containing protein [Desulfatiglandales bacterium]